MQPENQQLTPQPAPQTMPLQPITPANPSMQPGPAQPSSFGPTPASPQPSLQNVPPVPQPVINPQTIQGIALPDKIGKQVKKAWASAIASIVIFIVAILFGYVIWLAAFLGLYALGIGIKAKSTALIIVGSIGLALSGGGYLLSLLVS